MRRGRPGSSRDRDEKSQEEAHPWDGGVSRIFNIIVQATPGGDAGCGSFGEAAAWLASADPRGRRGEEEGKESITQIYICGLNRCAAAAGDECAQPGGQEGRVHPGKG